MSDKEYLNAVDTVCAGCVFKGQRCSVCPVNKMAHFHKTMPQDKEADLPVFMISFETFGRLMLVAENGAKALENFEKPEIQERVWNELKANGITIKNITQTDHRVAKVDLPAGMPVDLPEHIQ